MPTKTHDGHPKRERFSITVERGIRALQLSCVAYGQYHHQSYMFCSVEEAKADFRRMVEAYRLSIICEVPA